MAWTQNDIETLQQAIATGARRVRYNKDHEVEFRSLAEMQQTLLIMKRDVGKGAAPRRTVAQTFNGF